jgi:hypothetical protein
MWLLLRCLLGVISFGIGVGLCIEVIRGLQDPFGTEPGWFLVTLGMIALSFLWGGFSLVRRLPSSRLRQHEYPHHVR